MQGTGSFRLIVRRGPQPNQTYELNKDIVTIGRDITNDIVINDPEASRHHLRFNREDGGYTIEDLGSTNGTFVNGQRITGAKPLSNGDMIGLGETVTLGYEAMRGPSEGRPEDGGGVGSTVENRAPEQPKAPASPYSQPQPSSPSYAPASPDAQDSSYNSDSENFGVGSAAPPQAPPSGYYEEEYEEPQQNNTTRLVLIGCVVLLVFCCCVSLISAFIIDQNCLWYSLPIIGGVLDAIGQEPPLSQAACAARYGANLFDIVGPLLG